MELHRKTRPLRPGRGKWLVALVQITIACAKSNRDRADGGQATPEISVVAATAHRGDLGVYLNGLGAVTPLATVTVRPRVDGELMAVHYEEGQTVAAGALLAEIDPRPYEAQLLVAEGQLRRDQAALENARRDLRRYENLVASGSVPRQTYDTQRSFVKQLEGAVKSDQGQVANVKVQLVYTRITAPVSGRVGLRLVDPGNIVRASDTTGLVVITQLQPITVIFTLAEDHLPSLLAKTTAGEKTLVDAYNRELTRKLASGTLLTLDNLVDPTTGTVKVRSLFQNRDSALFPNQFVNARLLLDVLRQVVLIPVSAVQRGPGRQFVYVVRDDQTVEARDVKAGPSEGNEIAIQSGLEPGEHVVVEGADKLRPGSRVKPRASAGVGVGGSGDGGQAQ